MKSSFIKNIFEKLRNLLFVANGFDELSRFLLKTGAIVLLLGVILRAPLVSWIGFAIILFFYIRTFSKNKQKYYQQNRTFLRYKRQFTAFFYHQKTKVQKQKNRWEQRKTHRFYKCPSCGQKIRVPKGRGKISITCPSCSTKFVKKS